MRRARAWPVALAPAALVWVRGPTRARGHRRAVALGLAVCAALAGRAPAAGASPPAPGCPPAVVVEGPSQVAGPLAARLAGDGLAAPPPGCPATLVSVRAGRDGFELHIVDPFGRAAHRTVSTLGAAAAVVQSRARPELVLGLLSGGPGRASPRQPSRSQPPPLASSWRTAGGHPSAAVAVAAAGAPPSSLTSRITLALAPEASRGWDRSSWLGVAVAAGVTAGPTCIGAVVRVKESRPGDVPALVDVEKALLDPGPPAERRDVEAALTFELPRRLGRLSLRPGVDLGLGRTQARRLEPKLARLYLQGDARPLPPFAENDDVELRSSIRLAAALRLLGRWHLEAAIGAGASLLSREDGPGPDGRDLPGAPRAIGRASLGLRYGGP
jgi:hypothetical protein